MLHCLCCNATIQPWQEYCADCEEAIQEVYSDDTSYVKFLRGVHPEAIPNSYVSVNYGKIIDFI